MRIPFILAAAVAAVSLLTVPLAFAHKTRWSRMTLAEKRTLLVRTIEHDKSIVRWWLHHQDALPKLSFTFFTVRLTPTRMCVQLGTATPGPVCAHASRMEHAVGVLAVIDARIHARSLPAHNALWECLRPHEGSDPHNRDTGGNGHYGGLQMHPGWGYGTSYYASDDPWIVQKQAAERGYAASGYSSSFLTGQWGQTIGYCPGLG